MKKIKTLISNGILQKLLLVFVALFVISSAVYAQSAQPDEKFGVKLGVNISNLIDNNGFYTYSSQTPMIGFIGGVFAIFPLQSGFSLQPELLYSMKGTNYKYTSSRGLTIYSVETNEKLTYLEIPVLLRRSFLSGNIKPNLFFGPAFGIRMRAIREENSNLSGSTTEVTDVSGEYNTLDYGVVIGTGVEIKIGKVEAIFDVRYTFSVTGIKPYLYYSNSENSVISVIAGYCF